jgi:hypothetical protein
MSRKDSHFGKAHQLAATFLAIFRSFVTKNDIFFGQIMTFFWTHFWTYNNMLPFPHRSKIPQIVATLNPNDFFKH